MKGLFVKDLYLLSKQKNYVLCLLAISVFLLFRANNATFVSSYMTILGSFLALATISYDEMNQGRTFLFTLPITRSMYVSSKYVTGIVICLAAWGLSVVFTGAAMAAGRISSSWEEWLLSCVMFLGVGFLFDALMIPIQLKFGADRGRIVLLVVMLGCVFLGMTAGNMIQKMQLDVSGPVAFLNGLSPVGLGLLAAVVVLAALAISWLISMGIMRKKEF